MGADLIRYWRCTGSTVDPSQNGAQPEETVDGQTLIRAGRKVL